MDQSVVTAQTVKQSTVVYTDTKKAQRKVGHYYSPVTRGSRQTVTTIPTVLTIDWFVLAVTAQGMAAAVAMVATAVAAARSIAGMAVDDTALASPTAGTTEAKAEVAAVTNVRDDRRIGEH